MRGDAVLGWAAVLDCSAGLLRWTAVLAAVAAAAAAACGSGDTAVRGLCGVVSGTGVLSEEKRQKEEVSRRKGEMRLHQIEFAATSSARGPARCQKHVLHSLSSPASLISAAEEVGLDAVQSVHAAEAACTGSGLRTNKPACLRAN